jgi:hypothetical protein
MLVDITWDQFKRIGHVSRLPLNEQIRQYDDYCRWYQMNYDMNCNNVYGYNNKPSKFLLQENGFYLLQENGNKIII